MDMLIAPDESQDGGQLRILSSYNRTGRIGCDVKYFHQFSTYTYVYVDNNQNHMYFAKTSKLVN